MKNDTYEVLLRCYADAREGFAVVKDGIVNYANCALVNMAGENICGQALGEILPAEICDKINSAYAEKKNGYIECASVFGRTADIRAMRQENELLLIFTDLDAAMQEIRKNEESFKILKSAYKRLVDSITSMDSAAELMVKCMAPDIPEEAIAWLKMINTSVGNMSGALMDIVEVIESREENADKGCRLEDLTACVHSVCEQMGKRFEIKGARLEFSSEPERIVFPVNVKSIVNILLRLLDYMADCAKTGDVVRLCAKSFEDRVELCISDSAGNIPDEYLGFLKNPQLESMDKMFKAYGNNLYLVRRIAVFYDGCMDAENTGAGKRITVKLPRRQVSAHVQQNMQSMVREDDKPWWERI